MCRLHGNAGGLVVREAAVACAPRCARVAPALGDCPDVPVSQLITERPRWIASSVAYGYVLGKFAGGHGKSRIAKVRVWGAREVERTEGGWHFHVHLIIDLAGADARDLAKLLRAAWGTGARQVQVKGMQERDQEANIRKLARYMCKARYTHVVGDRVWMSIEILPRLVAGSSTSAVASVHVGRSWCMNSAIDPVRVLALATADVSALPP